MKTKKTILSVLAGVMISFAAVAENSGGGVRGGNGHVVDIDSTPYLLDLVTRSVCDWKSGNELIEESQALRDVIAKISTLDWYFASDLTKSIKDLNFCMTGPLFRQSTVAQRGSAVLPASQNVRQAGFRDGGKGYIDSEIYEDMNVHNRAMLIVHETMHSYLSMNTFDRPLKLRSIVKTLDQVSIGVIRSRAKFLSAIKNNEIEFPTTVGSLDNKKNQVLFLTGDEVGQTAMILASDKPESLIGLVPRDLQNLAPWDAAPILKMGETAILENALRVVIENASVAELSNILDQKVYVKLNPARIALGSFGVLTPEQKAVVLSSDTYQVLIQTAFAEVTGAEVFKGVNLVMATPAFQKLGAVLGDKNKIYTDVPLLDVMPADRLPEVLRWLPALMVILQQEGRLSSITDTADFYLALGLRHQEEAVKKMVVSHEREKAVVLERIHLIGQALVQGLMGALAEQVDAETYAEIKKQIKFERF